MAQSLRWCSPKVTTVIVDRVLSVDQDRINFGQLAVGTKAEVKARPKGHPTTSSPPR